MEWNYRFSLFLDIYIKQNSNRDCPRDNDNELSSQKCTSLCCKKRDVTVSCLFNLRVCLCLFYICDACMQLKFDGRVVGLKDSGTLDSTVHSFSETRNDQSPACSMPTSTRNSESLDSRLLHATPTYWWIFFILCVFTRVYYLMKLLVFLKKRKRKTRFCRGENWCNI